MDIKDKFDIEQQYQFYLNKVKLNEETMHPAQRVETRRAFYGAWSQLIFLVRDEMAVFPDNIRQGIITRMINELSVYWNKVILYKP